MRIRFPTPAQWLGRCVLWLYPTRQVEGIRIVFTDVEMDRDRSVARLMGIFETLRQVDQRYWARMQRYVRHIAVWKGHYTAYDRLGGIQLASSWFADSSDLYLASVLVHEVTHLRIYGFGINYDAAKRARIERRCVKQQVHFLRQVSDGAAHVTEVEALLESSWWTDEARREDVERLVREHGLPPWVGALLRRRQ